MKKDPTPAAMPSVAEQIPEANVLLNQLLGSLERARAAEAHQEADRKQLPSLILQLAQLAGQRQRIDQQSQQLLTTAETVIKDMQESAQQINESLAQQCSVLQLLLSNAQTLVQLSASAQQIVNSAGEPGASTLAPVAPTPAQVPIPASPALVAPDLRNLREKLLTTLRNDARTKLSSPRGARRKF